MTILVARVANHSGRAVMDTTIAATLAILVAGVGTVGPQGGEEDSSSLAEERMAALPDTLPTLENLDRYFPESIPGYSLQEVSNAPVSEGDNPVEARQAIWERPDETGLDIRIRRSSSPTAAKQHIAEAIDDPDSSRETINGLDVVVSTQANTGGNIAMAAVHLMYRQGALTVFINQIRVAQGPASSLPKEVRADITSAFLALVRHARSQAE